MTTRPRRLDFLEHLGGAACVVVLFNWSSEIASAISALLSQLLEGSLEGARLYFIAGVAGPIWTALLGLVLLGLLVIASERLVESRRIGAWAPPVCILVLATGALLPTFRAAGAQPNEAAVLSVTLGVLAALALSSYWYGALVIRWLRRRAVLRPRDIHHAG